MCKVISVWIKADVLTYRLPAYCICLVVMELELGTIVAYPVPVVSADSVYILF